MSNNYGTKRIVTGASYGLRDWMAQRVTALLMALFTIVLIIQVLAADTINYDSWASIFSQQWMKFLTFVVILSILYHAWVGVRDIFMDYIKPVGIRLGLHVFAIVWLMGCAGWAIQVLWRL